MRCMGLSVDQPVLHLVGCRGASLSGYPIDQEFELCPTRITPPTFAKNVSERSAAASNWAIDLEAGGETRNVRFYQRELDSWPRKAGLAERASAALRLSRVASTADGANSEECAG